MKKLYKLIGLIIVLSLLVIGCSTEDPEEKETKEPIVTETEKDAVETEDPVKDPDKDTDTELEELYSTKLVEMMGKDRYTMKINSIVDFEDQEMEALVTTVVAEGQSATTIESGDISMTSIIKDDKAYTVMHSEKMVIVSPVAEDEELGIDELDFSDVEYVEKGREDFLGNERDYEEYKLEDSRIRYYFDGKELDGMKIISDEDTAILDVEFFSDQVDMSVFEIPKDYEQVEY